MGRARPQRLPRVTAGPLVGRGSRAEVPGWATGRSGDPDVALTCWWARLVPDTFGCGVQGFPKL